MNGKAKRPKYVAVRSRRILGQNIKLKMQERYASEGDKYTALAQDCGTSRSTIERIVKGETGATIDTMTLLANALHCELHELLAIESKND